MPGAIGYGRFPPEVVALGKAMAHEARWQVLAHLDEHERARFTDLQKASGKASGSLSPHLKTLRQGGLIEKIAFTEGDEVVERYSLSPFGRRVLNRLEQAFSPTTRVEKRLKTGTDTAMTISLTNRTIDDVGTDTGQDQIVRPGADA